MDRVKLGIAGLGRLGKRHALNLCHKVQGVELLAACSPVKEERDWAHGELGITKTYETYHEMIEKTPLDAVFLVSPSTQHSSQIIQALEKGLHVFTEKPLGLTSKECREVQAAAAHKDQIVFVGFVRRFDPGYAHAKNLIDQGVIGEPFLLRSQTVDLDEYARFQVDFVARSGGIFLDYGVHDIDLARWFLNAEIQSVYAKGGSYVHKEFEAVNDADNTVVLASLDGGKMAVISASRTARHGHDTHTEITGTKGSIKIGAAPMKNRVQVFDKQGVRAECPQDFFERFHEGFLLEAQEFIHCVLEGRKPMTGIFDGLQATRAGQAMTESFRQGKEVLLNP